MIQLDKIERALLKRASKGKLEITVRDRGIVLAAGSEERLVAEHLVRRGHLQFEGYADNRTGFQIARYGITEHGRCVLDVVTGKIRLDPSDLDHPGCV